MSQQSAKLNLVRNTPDGAQIVLSELVRAGKLLEREFVGEYPLNVQVDESGIRIRHVGVAGFWAKLTGSSGSAYAWTELQRQASGAFATLPGGRTGTTTVNPAYEFNGTTGIANNTVVWLVQGYRNQTSAGLEYLFSNPTPTGFNGTLTVCTPTGNKVLTIQNGIITAVV